MYGTFGKIKLYRVTKGMKKFGQKETEHWL